MNGKVTMARSWDEARDLLACQPFWQGYIEVQAGALPNYDRYHDQLDGLRYEGGRYFACEVRRRMANGRLPAWPILLRPPHTVQCVAMDLVRERWGDRAIA